MVRAIRAYTYAQPPSRECSGGSMGLISPGEWRRNSVTKCVTSYRGHLWNSSRKEFLFGKPKKVTSAKSNTSLEPHNPAYSKQSSLEIGSANVCGNFTSPCEIHLGRGLLFRKQKIMRAKFEILTTSSRFLTLCRNQNRIPVSLNPKPWQSKRLS